MEGGPADTWITAEGIASPNPCRATVGNPAGHAAMRMTAFEKGWTNRRRCKATKRDGTPCGRLAMTRYGVSVRQRDVGDRRPHDTVGIGRVTSRSGMMSIHEHARRPAAPMRLTPASHDHVARARSAR